MLEIIFTILFVVIFIKTAGLALKISWGIAKLIACVLFVLALPALVLGLVFAGGLLLLVPVVLVLIAFGILKAA